ncbi:hypothetical protein ACSBR2_015589 [Camellia fascicularis]
MISGRSNGRKFYGGIAIPLKKGCLSSVFQFLMSPLKSVVPKNRPGSLPLRKIRGQCTHSLL